MILIVISLIVIKIMQNAPVAEPDMKLL